jgi:hypothetical protein
MKIKKLNSNEKLAIVVLVFILLTYCLFNKDIELFPSIYTFGYPTRLYNSTRNMSYDLRCEPEIRHHQYVFLNSSINPYYKRQTKCLDI